MVRIAFVPAVTGTIGKSGGEIPAVFFRVRFIFFLQKSKSASFLKERRKNARSSYLAGSLTCANPPFIFFAQETARVFFEIIHFFKIKRKNRVRKGFLWLVCLSAKNKTTAIL